MEGYGNEVIQLIFGDRPFKYRQNSTDDVICCYGDEICCDSTSVRLKIILSN